MSAVPDRSGATRAALVWVALGLALLLPTLAIFGPGLGYPFVALDDIHHVVENPALRDLSWDGVRGIFRGDARDARYYPLTYLSYAIDHRIAGFDPFAFHLTNLLLHAACVLAVAALVRLLLRDTAVAFVTALLFAIHPLQVEPVVWVMGRKSVLSALLFVLAAIAYLLFARAAPERRGFRAAALASSALLYLLSCLAKATGVTLPAVLVLIDACRDPAALARPLAFLGRSLRSKLVFVPPAIAVVGLTLGSGRQSAFATEYAFAWHEWLAICGYGLFFYVEKTFAPFALGAFYPLPAPGAVPVRFYVYGVAAIGLAGLALWGLLRGRRALGFGLGWYFVTLLPSALILAIYRDMPLLVADRYFYGSAPGLFLPIAAAACALWRERPALRVALAPLAGATVAALVVLSSTQRATWRSSIAVYEQLLVHHPSDEFYYRLALEYDAAGRSEDAYRALDAAARAPNRTFYLRFCYYQLMLADLQRRKGDYAAAAARFEAAIESTPNVLEPADARTRLAYLYLADLFERAGDAAAGARARAAAARAPRDPGGFFERTWLEVAPDEARRFLAQLRASDAAGRTPDD